MNAYQLMQISTSYEKKKRKKKSEKQEIAFERRKICAERKSIEIITEKPFTRLIVMQPFQMKNLFRISKDDKCYTLINICILQISKIKSLPQDFTLNNN